jgi:pseudouridine synthase
MGTMSNPKRPRAHAPSVLSGEQRINKLLAAAGLGSRRQVDELIADGRVEIDGKTITQVGIKVDADKVKVSVDGEPLRRHKPLYFAVHKPAGVLCTNRDPEGRPRAIDLVPGHHRLFPVGRLDASSTGLILLTNDGELAQRLAHPRHSVPKNYFVVVAGQVEIDAMKRLQRGIYLAEGLARVDGAKIRKVRKGCTEIEITLSEGKNREIRRVLARLGHRVVTLRRTAIGPLKLANLPEGGFRSLAPDEVAALYQAVDDIKREKKTNRKERDKRRAEEMDQLEKSDSIGKQKDAPELASSNQRSTLKGKKTRPQSVPKRSIDEQANTMLDSLPPISENPYRQSDDEDDVMDPGYENAILVREHGPSSDVSVKPGKVLGYSDDQDEIDEDDEFDSAGMGFESFDDDDDDHSLDSMSQDDVESPSESMSGSSPWSQAKPRRALRNGTQSENTRGRPPRGNARNRKPRTTVGRDASGTDSSTGYAGSGNDRNLAGEPMRDRSARGRPRRTSSSADRSTRRPAGQSDRPQSARVLTGRPQSGRPQSGRPQSGRPQSDRPQAASGRVQPRGVKRSGKPSTGRPTNRKGGGGGKGRSRSRG